MLNRSPYNMMKNKVKLVAYTVTVAFVLHNLRHPLIEPDSVSVESTRAWPFKHIAKTPDGICSLFPATNPSMVWKKLQSAILKASYWPERNANNTAFISWVDELFINHFNSAAIGKALLQRADPYQVEPILGVISKRLAYLENNNLDYSEPLRIFVSGGSVTAGNNCETNPVGLPAADWRRIVSDCPWPIRLQQLFNKVLFEGNDVVRVTNLAAGGSSSEIGRVALEYHLFPKDVLNEMPHIIIWSHAANDAQEKDLNAVYYKHLPNFISAARNVRPCDKELPLVLMFEDSYYFSDYNIVNEMSGMIAKVSAWFGLMSASHANVVNHMIWTNQKNSSAIQSIMGTDVNLHYG